MWLDERWRNRVHTAPNLRDISREVAIYQLVFLRWLRSRLGASRCFRKGNSGAGTPRHTEPIFNSLVKLAAVSCPRDQRSATLLLGLSPHALFSKALGEKGDADFGPSLMATKRCESSIPLFS